MTNHPNILVVDDDEAMRARVAEILTRAGYHIETAANGEAALNRLQEEPKPALVLLDMMMPVCDGWEFMAHKQQDDPLDIPVLILTSVGIASERWAKELGAQGLLRKPFGIDNLLAAVARLVNE